MPDITFPPVDINKAAAELNNALKESAYVALGLGVIGFQRAQVQRVELTKQLEAQLEQLSTLPTTINSQFEEYAQTARTQLNEQMSELSKRLEEVFGPVRAQLAKAVPADLPKFPDFGQQLSDAGDAIEEQLGSVRNQLTELAKAFDERVQPVRKQVDEQIDRLEQYLPGSARNVVQSVRSASTTPEQVLRNAVGLS